LWEETENTPRDNIFPFLLITLGSNLKANSSAFPAIKKQALIILSQFTLEIAKANSAKEIFAFLAKQLPQILPADRCSVTLLSKDKKELEVFALHGEEGALTIGKSFSVGNSFAGEALLQNKTFKHTDYGDSGKVDAKQLYQQNIKSLINSPIEYDHGVIGTLNIGSLIRDVYDEHSLELMSLITKLVSSCLERQHLLKQAELGIQHYKKYSIELEELALVAKKLSSATSEDEVFKIVAKSVIKIVAAQRISYALFIESKQSFDIKIIDSNKMSDLSLFIPLQNSALGQVYISQKGQFFEDLNSFTYTDINLLCKSGFKSSWASPVTINGEVVGILNAACFSTAEDGHTKLSVLNMLSGILGVTLTRIKLQKKIEYQAAFDVLTGLPNRNQLNVFMQEIIEKEYQAPFTVLFIDLDRFKTVNDTLGHAIGDKLLQQVTIRIQQQIRKYDFSSRHGGDEFVVILTDCDSVEISKRVSQQIIDAIKLPFFIDEYRLHIGASIGLSRFPFDSLEPEKLLEYSDIAMYFVKQNGSSNYQIYSNNLLETIEYKQSIDSLLRMAIKKNELSIVYQPLFSEDKVIGLEALLRWNNKTLGIVSPEIFIPIAEESLLIEEITEWVLKKSITTIKSFRTLYPDLYVAVNISAKDCLNPKKLQQMILTLLQESNLPGSALELEITENVLIDDVAAIRELFKNLQSQGVRFAIDDFGTGFSSLTYLLSLPFNTIKIDQSFIVHEDKARLGIIKGIIEIASSLSMHCIAEGIETIEQKESLKNLGCKRFQGYYFSHPLPLDEVTTFLLIHHK
jgi:diguanylate cyclase (GGDEF)-like protein